MASVFDANFTFLSGHTESLAMDYGTSSSDVSPFTSRCSSPQITGHRNAQRRASRDTRYDSYRSSQQNSIAALTAQLQSHGLQDHSAFIVPDDGDNSTESEQDDEGFYDGPETPATTASDISTDFDPSLYDLSMSELGATSSPRPSMSLEAQALSSYTSRRRQRQALVRLQCIARRAPDLAMLIEECHPSSLPLSSESIFTGGSRSNSTCSAVGPICGRIEKERAVSVRRLPRMRKRATR